jgi:uncharacterized C2H2 Zn-finger protein
MSDEIVRCPNCGRVMREGKVTSRQVGAAPLRSWIEQALAV